MTSLYNVANVLHSALVLSFVGVTALLMVVSAIRRSRLHKIRLLWGSGRLLGLPLIPTLFLAVVVGLIGFQIAVNGVGLTVGWMVLLGYLVGGIFWYVASMLTASVVITDWGLSRRRSGKTETLPWHSVTDYLVRDEGRQTTYVFFRVDDRGKKQRFELNVPPARLEQFKETVEAKLDARYNYHVRRPAGKWAMKQ